MNIVNNNSDATIIKQNEIEQVQQAKQEFKLLGTYLRTAGLNLYCYNPHKDTVEQVEKVKTGDCLLTLSDGKFIPSEYKKQSVTVDPTWEYFEALNMKNAIKRVEKFKQGKIKSIWNLRIPNKEPFKLF